GATQSAHLAAVPRVLLPLLRVREPVALGRAVPARRLWPLGARRRALRDRAVTGAPRLGAADGLRLRPRARTSEAAVRGPRVVLLRAVARAHRDARRAPDRKSTRLNSSHVSISYAVFCLKK